MVLQPAALLGHTQYVLYGTDYNGQVVRLVEILKVARLVFLVELM